MSESCEIVEGLVVATSSCPATDVITVQSSVGNGTSSAMSGITQPTVTESGNATSQVTIDAYAMMINVAEAHSDVSPSLVVTSLISNAAQGKSSLFAVINEMADAAANATDEILVADASHLLVSAAQAVSSIAGAGTIADVFVESKGEAKSSASLGLLEAVTSSANATGLIAVLQRRVDDTAISTADATSSATPSGTPETYLLLSTANGTSLVQVQTDVVLSISSSAEVTSDVWFKDPTSKAWVMNTETTAVGWYDNFSFESIVSWKGRELAVGPDGVHELTGDSDNGQKIDALVESGFADFGVAQTKRLDNMYFGYTSDGQIAVKAEVYESGSPPSTYLLEERDANAPRNSRVTPGKGLWGRYWRLTISNVDGADFEVHDASVDIAVSTRRI